MINIILVGQFDLHLEALAQALTEAGEIECRRLPLEKFLVPDTFRQVNNDEVIVLLDFADEQSQYGKLLLKVRRLFPRCRLIFLTEADDPRMVMELINRGAWGVFPKSGSLTALKKAVRAVTAGEVWVDRQCSSQVIRKIIEGKQKPRQPMAAAPTLSKRERQILALVGCGMKNRGVAEKLNISEMTVKAHLNSIFRKIGVKDRLQAALFAIHNGIVTSRIPID